MGQRGPLRPASPLPGSHRRARPLAVARQRAEPRVSRVAGGRSATPRASKSPGDTDHLSLLGLVQRQPSRARHISAAGSPAKRFARGSRAWGPTTCPGMMRIMREVGSTLSYLHDLGQPHGCVSSTTIWTAPMGTAVADRLAVVGELPRYPARTRPGSALHAERSGMGKGRMAADRSLRPVAARRGLLRDAHRRSSRPRRDTAAAAAAAGLSGIGRRRDRPRAQHDSRRSLSRTSRR